MLNVRRTIALFSCGCAVLLCFCANAASAQLAPAFSEISQASRREADSSLPQAPELIRQGRMVEAEAAIRRYLASGQESETAHVLLGLVLYQEHRPADSLGEFTKAAKFGRPKASELVVVALDYLQLRDLASSDKWMSMAAQMDPENGLTWRYLGGIRYSENRFAEAISAYQRCLRLRPRDVPAEDGIGRSLEGLSRDQEAEAAYRMALEWQAGAEKKYPEPLLHLGELLTRHGQASDAIPLLQQAEALDADDADVHEQLGEALVAKNHLRDGEGELEKALKLAPENSHLHWLLASVYRKEGRTDAAEREREAYAALLGSHSSDKLH